MKTEITTNEAKRSKKRDYGTTFCSEVIHHPYTRLSEGKPEDYRKRIRDIERVLRHGKSQNTSPSTALDKAQHDRLEQMDPKQKRKALPATKMMDLERELRQKYRQEAIRVAEQQRLKVMRRYKKVKFTEAQKARKRYKQAQRAVLAASTEQERQTVQQSLHDAEVDKNYAEFVPLGWKYVALFCDKDSNKPSKGDARMRSRVEQAMQQGTLEQLRNELTIQLPTLAKFSPDSIIQRSSKYQDDTQDDTQDDEDGGDFFE